METIIKSSELRAGNYLKGEEFSIPRLGIWSNGVFQITELGIAHLAENPRLGQVWKPIPITEQWLLDAGFEKDITSVPAFILGNCMVEMNSDSITIYLLKGIVDEEGELASQVQCEWEFESLYLHFFQNFYFFNFNEELIFNR